MSEINIIQDGNINDIPYDKHDCLSSGNGVCPAFNSGKVTLKCLINGISPFMKTNLVNDTLFFNRKTFGEKILELYPESVRNSVKTFSGEEGITLKSRVNYRHTYITAKPKSGSKAFEDNVWDDLTSLNEVINSQIYKEHQTFIIGSSLFGASYLTPSEYLNIFGLENVQCLSNAIWQYSFLNTESWASDADEKNDNFVSTAEPKSEVIEIQYPNQIASDTCSGFGIHWGLDKKTPLFRGQDFYVEFRRQSDVSNIPSLEKEQKPSTLYTPLDANADLPMLIDTESGLEVMPNQALVEYEPEIDPYTGEITNLIVTEGGRNAFDFTNQSYYMIRMGSPSSDPDAIYYIIICQKSNPIFVRTKNSISWRVSEFKGFNTKKELDNDISSIGGKELISADWFRMEVKNYLGKILIEFIGPNFKSSPWVIERMDLRKTGGNQRKLISVPRGYLNIKGGNILTGFSFGPLQYSEGLTIRHPSTTMSYGVTNENNDFSLPILSSSQDVLLDTSDNFIDTTNLWHLVPGQSLISRLMYTQDAQVFTESVNDSQISSDGSFFGFRPIRESPVDNDIINDSFSGTLPLDLDTSGLNSISRELTESEISIEKINTGIDPGNRRNTFFLNIRLKSGDHSFIEPLVAPDGSIILDTSGNPTYSRWDVKSCVPPVLTMIRLVARANETPRWNVASLDASDNIMNFSETWNATDFSKVSHTGNIQFLLNEGMVTENNVTEQILELRDKSFYIEIWAGYTSQGADNSFKNLDDCNYSRIPGLYKLFTGICSGGTVSRSYGKRIMDCKIDDYSDVLKNTRFFNAPFWDGVRDVNAMNELLEIAGFRSDVIPYEAQFSSATSPIALNNYGPRHQIKNMASTVGTGKINLIFPDGRTSYSIPYALPSSYARLTQPFFKAKDGDKLQDMAIKISERGGKVFFFDQFGVAHFENFFDQFQNVVLGGANTEVPIAYYTTNPDVWIGQLIFNNMTLQHDVESTFNHIKLLTNTPDFTIDFFDDVNWASYDEPGAEGFIGYLKMFYQAEGVIGSKIGSLNLLEFYRRTLFRPPLVVNFESYGQPIRSLDLIYLNDVPLRVMKVDNTIDPVKNVWWQKVECEWSQWSNPVPTDNLMTRNP